MARRTKEDAYATRSSLLDAAEQVFYEQGVARASLSEIAHRAGATRGAVYWHFKDKLDLFYAVLDRVTLPLEQAAYGDETGGGQLQGLDYILHVIASVYARLEGDARTRRVFEVLLHKVEYVGELLPVRDRNMAAMMHFDAKLEAALLRAQEVRQVTLAVRAGEAALTLRCLFEGVVQAWLLSGAGFDLSAVGMRAVRSYLRGLGFAAAEGEGRVP